MTPLRFSDKRYGNSAGIAAMLISMAGFTANDTCIKLLSEHLPLGEIIVLRGATASLYIAAIGLALGGLHLPANPPRRLLGWRVLAEISSTLFFLSGLIRLPIADATALAQATPLVMTAAAAIWLKEPIGTRHWLAALAGLIGVLLIVQPGSAAFTPAAVLILIAVVLVVMRDLATRRISHSVPTLTLTLMSALAVMPSGFLLLPFETWAWPSVRDAWLVVLGGLFLAAGYAFIIIAMRAGDVAVIAPFRYGVIIFGLLSGYLVWGQIPNIVALTGIVILTAAGLYTFHRERALLSGVPTAGIPEA